MLKFRRFQTQDIDHEPCPTTEFTCPVSPEATQNLFAGCDDFLTRDVAVGGTNVTVFLCWIDGTVSGDEVGAQVLRPLTDPVRFGDVTSSADAEARLSAGAVYGCDMKRVTVLDELAEAVACGNCAVVFDGAAYVFQLRSNQRRAVQEPSIEKSVKGSKDAFVETLRVNTNLVRLRLRTPRLKLRQIVIGRRSRTAAAVLWLEDAVPPELPLQAIRRLETLEIDGLLQPDTLDSVLSDAPRSPFPQLIHTERPDKFAAALLDGRVGVLTDGIPVGFLVPATLPEFMKTGEDGAQHYLAASFLRALRWAGLLLTLFLPALYVAIAMYHAEMIPVELLLSVIDSKQSVPFSTPAEILGMLLSFELLQEAGLRLPEPVGETLGIIGALIVGQSAVEAKVVSPIAVIVVAVAGIAGYTMPSQDMSIALRLCRLALTVAAAAAGLYGIVVGAAFLLWHLCSLESFGRPYITTDGPVFRRRPGTGKRRAP